MVLFGQILTITGVAGILISTALEIKRREPIYALLMKVTPMVFAIGLFMWTLG